MDETQIANEACTTMKKTRGRPRKITTGEITT
jgi:hypothetical protein